MSSNNNVTLSPVSEEVVVSDASSMIVPQLTKIAARSEDPTLGSVPRSLVDDILTRPALIYTQAIANTDVFASKVFSLDPLYLYTNLPFIAQRLVGYRNFTAGLKVTALISCPGSCYGLYVLQALAEGDYQPTGFDGPSVDSIYSSVGDNFAFIDGAVRNTIEMSLPYLGREDAYVVGAGSYMHWRLIMYTAAPLTSTLAVTATGQINIYACFEPGYVMSSLCFQGKRLVQGSKDGAGKKASSYLSDASKVAGYMGMIPELSPLAMPVAAGLAAMSTVADLFGFTREAAPQPPRPVVPRLFSNLANIDGEDTGEVVALMASNSISSDPAVGGGEHTDICSLESLGERWGWVGSFSVDQTTTVGTSLFTIPVSPVVGVDNAGTAFLPPIGYVGLPFSGWRGDMEYLVYIPSADNVTGKLQVVWDPIVAYLPVYPTDPTHRLKNAVIDLAGTTETLLNVPYAARRPCLQVVPGLTIGGYSELQVNGCLHFRLVAPVSAPRTPTPIKIIVLARSRNMKYGVPRNAFFRGSGTSTTLDAVTFQGAEDEVASITLGEPASDYPTSEVLWGEDFRSIRGLFQKFSPLPQFAAGGGSAVPYGIVHVMPRTTSLAAFSYVLTATSTQQTFTWVGYYSALFCGVKGSMRYKFSPVGYHAISPTFIALAVPLLSTGNQAVDFPNDDNLFLNKHFDLQNVSADSAEFGAEFTLPYYSHYKFQSPQAVLNMAPLSYSTTTQERVNAFYFRGNNLEAPTVSPFVAGGPDYGPVRFRRVPGLVGIE